MANVPKPSSNASIPNAFMSSKPTPPPDPFGTTYAGIAENKNAVNAENLNLYLDYEIINYYLKDTHNWYGGVSSPGGFQGKSAVVFQLAAPKLLWVCEWTSLEVASQPKIPDITTQDQNWVLIDEDYRLFKIDVGPDQAQALYRIGGIYVFGHLQPSAETLNNARFGIPPYLNNQFDRTMPARLRTRNLIDGTATAAKPVLQQGIVAP